MFTRSSAKGSSMSFQQRWSRLCTETIGTPRFWRVAVDHRAAYHALAPLIERHSKGVVVDAGAGALAGRALLQRRASAYIAADYRATHPDIALVCDLTIGIPLASGSVDTVFCCSVLEHVEEPVKAMAEFSRILRPGGTLILSVPFLYYLHDAPIDFFRFTRHGVELMARRAGLSVGAIEVSGGLAHTLLHALSMGVAALAGPSRIGAATGSIAAGALWRLARLIDRLDRGSRFAQNVNAVLVKG
jgi:SAM-dependent methyltransferase